MSATNDDSSIMRRSPLELPDAGVNFNCAA
jgi:hypothetical protein